MTQAPNYICPICSEPLSIVNHSLQCENFHNFDFAKEGYVHLLPVQHKKSLNPGDDKNMVLARRAFLSAGYYDFLRDKLSELLRGLSPTTLIDLGCGEGFYTNYFEQQIPAASVYGVDISKSAVRYAAKRNKNVHYSVGTISSLPFADGSADIIVNVFAPLVADECRRLLAETGQIVRVSPGARHLWQLKSFVYDSPMEHDLPTELEGFTVTDRIEVSQKTKIPAQAIVQLLKMTPLGWKIKPEALNKLKSLESLEIELDFLIDTLQLTV